MTLERKGDFDEARRLLEEAVEINRRTPGTNSPEYAISLHNLGSALIDRGDLPGAEVKLREALAVRRVIFADGHPDLALSLNNLGYVLLENEGRLARSGADFKRGARYPPARSRDRSPAALRTDE